MKLNDVDQGGYTVFTALGIAIPPKKGSAVFWYNVKKNEDQNMLSIHGGMRFYLIPNINSIIFKILGA